MEGKDEKLTPSSSKSIKDKSELDKENKTDHDGEDKVEIPSTAVVPSTSQVSDEKIKSEIKNQQSDKEIIVDSQKKCEVFGGVRESAPESSFGGKRKNGEKTKPDKQASSKNCTAGPSTASVAAVEHSKAKPSTKKVASQSPASAVQLMFSFYKLLRSFDKMITKQRESYTCNNSLKSNQTLLRQELMLEGLRRKLLQLILTGRVPDSPLTSTSEDDDEEEDDAQRDEGEDEQLLHFSFDSPNASTFGCSTLQIETTAPPMAAGNCNQLTDTAKQIATNVTEGKEKNAENSSTSIEKEKSGNEQSENEKRDDYKKEDSPIIKESPDNQQKKN